ncbi:MAG: hypothetical protein IT299_03510 [Dehalococcoidia bacterium]|nr:hypothetical protein [Dehalococcoidia bacterium]
MAIRRADPLVPVAFAPDPETAQRYVDALERAGLEAHVRIEDGAHLAPAGSAYGAITSGEPFVYPVLVSRLQRRAARRALEAVRGPEPVLVTRSHIVGVAACVLGAVLTVAAAAWLRGDL